MKKFLHNCEVDMHYQFVPEDSKCSNCDWTTPSLEEQNLPENRPHDRVFEIDIWKGSDEEINAASRDEQFMDPEGIMQLGHWDYYTSGPPNGVRVLIHEDTPNAEIIAFLKKAISIVECIDDHDGELGDGDASPEFYYSFHNESILSP